MMAATNQTLTSKRSSITSRFLVSFFNDVCRLSMFERFLIFALPDDGTSISIDMRAKAHNNQIADTKGTEGTSRGGYESFLVLEMSNLD